MKSTAVVIKAQNIIKNAPKSNKKVSNSIKPYEMDLHPNNLNNHPAITGNKIKNNGKDFNNQITSSPNTKQFNPNEYIHMNRDQIANWKVTNEDDLHVMSQKHEQLIGVILSEEEGVIGLHRQHIDDMVELIKQVVISIHIDYLYWLL